ncbi:simple sugar transport system permease protein [Mycoplasmopsis mustelae]|uniref:Simple sugar transport system permease protein n=1 Tax=Mycoplasmopsis mustelae TaxID=171289 RepID=A0A4R7UEG8_9BACT|nr:ABC transporter permease [Mycoplasmopsis mustelae]TDV24321.1 simple sugar transport system permease protein [Mycoplasmopsis mustelae]
MQKHNSQANKFANFMESTRRFFQFEDKKNTRRKIYSSLWSIFFGLLLASIIYWIIGSTGKNAQNTTIFTFISYVFSFATDSLKTKDLLLYFIFFGFAGLGVSLGFKSGLFNIGVANQMTTPAIIFFTILISARMDTNNIPTAYLILMLFIFMIVGFIMGSISGILKAYFRVHEVISTIFLNWIIAYLSQYLFNARNGAFGSDANQWFSEIGGTATIFIEENTIFNFIYVGIILVIVASAVIWFIYSKTTIGYKIKMVGLNKTNAKYVGINEKIMTVIVMGISGGLIGIGGFFYIILQNGALLAKGAPLTIGFDSIAIALIALNSPIGVILTSWLYSFLYTSESFFQSVPQGSEQIKSEFFMLIYGIIIFIASLSLMFYKFRVMRWFAKYSYLITNKAYWKKFNIYWKHKFNETIPGRFKLIHNWILLQNKKIKFKKQQKEYENYVAQEILRSKQYTNEKLMQMYNEFSKKKVEQIQKMESYGLNDYTDKLNIFKNNKHTMKVKYNEFKEDLYIKFLDLIKQKYFKIFKITEGDA